MDAAVAVIAREGTSSVSLRALARDLGVSHAAPVHHFGDKAGLLTVIAAEGFERLAAELRQAWDDTGSFLELGVAYVRFATSHPAHFEVMFRPDLYRRDDPAVARAREETAAMLYGRVQQAAGRSREPGVTAHAGIAAWALVHGLATLWLNGNVPADVAEDPTVLARETASFLFARRRRTR